MSVVEDVKSTTQAHFRGLVDSVTILALALGVWVVCMILRDVPRFLVLMLVPGNRTPGSLGKRAEGKPLIKE
jgi:hypothetical protein